MLGHGFSKHLREILLTVRNQFQCAFHGAWNLDLPSWQILADTDAPAKRIQAPPEMFAHIFMKPALPGRNVLTAEE